MTVLRSYVGGAWTEPADEGRPVFERIQVELSAELAIDAHQQVLVERLGDSGRIIVGGRDLPWILHQVADHSGWGWRHERIDVAERDPRLPHHNQRDQRPEERIGAR